LKTQATKSWIDEMDWNNLVPYTHPAAAWCDRHSILNLHWNQDRSPGLQVLQVSVGWAGTAITDELVACELYEDGKLLPLALDSRIFRPDKVIEVNKNDDFQLKLTSSFIERNAIGLEVEIKNCSSRERKIVAGFRHPGKGVSPNWEGVYPEGKIVAIEHEPKGSWSTLFPVHEHGRQTIWVKNYVAGLTEGTTLELVCLADLANRELHIPAGESFTFTTFLAFGLNRGRAKEVYRKCEYKLNKGWTSVQETERWQEIFRQAPKLPAKYERDLTYVRMYAHAIASLNGLFVQGEGGFTGDKRIPWTTTNTLASGFFWDTAFSCMGALEFSTTLCQEAIESFVDNVSPRGGMPGTLVDTNRAGEGQAPVMSTVAWMVYKKSKDKGWLKRVYPTLGGYLHFWQKYYASSRGLCQYYNSGQIGDNDARFDPVYTREQINESVDGFESPDLCAFIVVEMRCLACMADELGLTKESGEWRRQAEELAQRIVETFYFKEHTMFFDVKEGTKEIFSGAKGPNMFLPIWAQVPLDDEEISKVIEHHMLNPNEFYRELPFPSLSYDDPKYDPNSYWRGRIWPHIVFLMIQTLWRHGYHKEAEQTADRILTMFRKTPWLHECYESSEGNAVGYSEQGELMGYPDYNWSLATVIRLLLERYKDIDELNL
jgi:hypothetical protein